MNPEPFDPIACALETCADAVRAYANAAPADPADARLFTHLAAHEARQAVKIARATGLLPPAEPTSIRDIVEMLARMTDPRDTEDSADDAAETLAGLIDMARRALDIDTDDCPVCGPMCICGPSDNDRAEAAARDACADCERSYGPGRPCRCEATR